eukprot:GSMAST32.ASY1.ANO1.1063.1 assembled CDS
MKVDLNQCLKQQVCYWRECPQKACMFFFFLNKKIEFFFIVNFVPNKFSNFFLKYFSKIYCCFFSEGDPITVAPNSVYEGSGKIKQYVAFADNIAGEAADHGTHVRFIFFSNFYRIFFSYEIGIAYDAQIAFFDIGIAENFEIFFHNPLYDQFFPPAYNSGARIHTNSWGVPLKNSYDINVCFFFFNFEFFFFFGFHFLVLYAAGNEGQEGPGSVGSPATNKNGLSVGASSSPLEGYVLFIFFLKFFFFFFLKFFT